MKKRKTNALFLLIIGISLSIAFIMKIEFTKGLEAYFKREYYNQFGPLAISVELLIASYYLFIKHKKTNFTLALFGFTALLDPFFNQIGIFNSIVPLYGTIILSICGLISLWLAFTNTYKLKQLIQFRNLL
ncbi:hypothetical protein [Polaribacter ponticola]|uniref:DoxX family protein n=1 Tax=Polaribacter ponticola TaxID=2978475 RepID=A0ABT5S892_9FLAO|nr:hypothetical protein [Polaribacter sp. MSW5]MDD7914313.1 hypothetical protein [Polaribacter sp. MSW5]